MINRRFLTRKDIAQELEVSPDSIRRNEVRLGLREARRDVNGRLVRYDAAAAYEALRKRKMLPVSA